MNDEQFEEEMCALEDCGHEDFVEALRDRDSAQRQEIARLRAALATQPAGQLWAVHAQGPDDLYAAFSREDAEAFAAGLNALPCPPGISVSAVVIESPWPAAEHWKYLAEQWKYLADKEQESNSPPAAAHGDEAVQFEIADVVAVSREDLLAMSGDVCPSTGRSEMECLLAQWLKGNDIPVFRRRLYAMRAQAGEGGEV